MGLESIRIVERGSDVGGTWYWNRYPGAACDVVSYDYLPLLDELDYVPVNHYSRGPEIFGHRQAIARKYHLYDLAVFNTTVTETRWDQTDQLWHVETDQGDVMRAQFVICANGTLAKPAQPLKEWKVLPDIRSIRLGGITITPGEFGALERQVGRYHWHWRQRGANRSRTCQDGKGSFSFFSARLRLLIFAMIWPTDPNWARKLQRVGNTKDAKKCLLRLKTRWRSALRRAQHHRRKSSENRKTPILTT